MKKVSGHNVFKLIANHLVPNNLDVVGTEIFENENAKRINTARMEHLENLALPLAGKRVLDVGCGIGHWTDFFLKKNCSLVSIDARQENIDLFRSRHPLVESHVLNIESNSGGDLGIFDIVFCYGLFYHLENPVVALRNMASVCGGILLLETLVMDHELPLCQIVDESLSANQALGGLGHRPTPGYVVFLLNRAGFNFIYTPKIPPHHPDFEFEWKNNLETTRAGRNLRCIFVASKNELKNKNLNSIVSK